MSDKKDHEDGGEATIETVCDNVPKWVGDNPTVQELKTSLGEVTGARDVSEDGTKGVRLTTHEVEGSHIHFEVINPETGKVVADNIVKIKK